jgi:hypothetical protein
MHVVGDAQEAFPFLEDFSRVVDTENQSRIRYKNATLVLLSFIEHLGELAVD